MIWTLKKDSFFGDGVRFIIVGAGNTVFTLLIYQIIVSILSPLIAYYLSWLIGLLVLFFAFPAYVFRGIHLTLLRALAMIVVYGSSLFFGGQLLEEMQARTWNPRLAIFFVLMLTTGFNFMGSRMVFRLMRP